MDIKELVLFIIGGAVAVYVLAAIVPGAGGNLAGANWTGQALASTIAALIIPIFLVAILLKVFGYV